MAGCPSLDLQTEAPDAVIACANDEQCPTDTRCAIRIGRCLPTTPADADAPSATATADPALLFRGAVTRITVVVSEPLGVTPTMVVTGGAGGDEPALLQSGAFAAGDTTFVFTFTVDSGETAAALTPVVTLVDRFDNAADVTFDAIPVDVVGPVVLPDDIVVSFGGNEALGQTHATSNSPLSVAVTITEAGARAVAARAVQGEVVIATFSQQRDGSFSTLTLPLLTSDADLVVEVDAEDAVDNRSVVRSNPVPVDLTPPQLVIGDVRVDDDNAADLDLVTTATVSVTLADAGDAIAWCAHLVSAGGCVDDGDFVAATTAIVVGMPATAGPQTLRAVVRDRALLTAAVTTDFVALPAGAPVATVALGAPVGQQDVKPGDVVTVAGTSLPGATATAVFVDAASGAALASAAAIVVGSAGAINASLVVPNTVTDGQQLALDVNVTLGGTLLPTARSTNALRVDTSPPTVAISVVGGALQSASDVTIAWTIVGAATVAVSGDVASSGAVDAVTATSGVVAVTLNAGDGARDVRFTARDRAGQVTIEQLTVVVDSNLPAVALLARNVDRATDGVRPGSLIDFAGTTDLDVTVESGRVIYFNAAGTELAACEQPVSFLLTTGVGADAAISVAVPLTVNACAGAATVQGELIVRNAVGTLSVAAASRSGVDIDDDGVIDAGAFGYDDVAPVVQSVAFDIDRSAPPGIDALTELRAGVNLLVAPTRTVGLTVAAQDSRALTAIVGAVAVRSGGQSFALPAAAQSLSLQGADGDKVVAVTVEDDVGNATVVNTTIVLDTTPPGAPLTSGMVYIETSADGSGNDATSAFTLAGNAGTTEGRARAALFGAAANAATAPLGIVGQSNDFGGFIDVVVTSLGAPVQAIQVVAVDRAGHRSAVTTITRPRFTLTPPAAALGPNGANVAIAVGAGTLAGSPAVTVRTSAGTAVPGNASDIVVSGAGTAFTGAIGLDVADGLLQGNGAAVVRAAGGGPGLSGASVSFDTVAIDVDFTRPVVNAALLQLTDLGGSFLVTGAAGAVSDRAGVDVKSVAGLTIRSNAGTDTINANGSFTVTVAGAVPDTVNVDVVADAAGNTGIVTTLTSPVVAAITANPATATVNDVLVIGFTVTDPQALAGDPVVQVGGRTATRQTAVTVGQTTTFSYTLLVQNDGNGGLQALRIEATDTSGHRRLTDVADAVDFNLPNPDTDGDGICDGPLAVATVCTAGPDADPNDRCVPVADAACDACGTVNPNVAGGILFEEESVIVDGVSRTFGVRYPDAYDQNRPYPITFVFHGDLTCDDFDVANDRCVTPRQTASEQRGIFGLEAVVDGANGNAVLSPGLSEDSILVYVNGANRNVFNPEFFSWDTFNVAATNPDIKAVLAIKSRIQQELCVDANTTLAVGFSGGGFFAHTLGCMTGLVSAVATFEGGFEDGDPLVSQDPLNVVDVNACVAQTPRALLIHSPDDTTVPIRYADQAASHYAARHTCDAVAPVPTTTLGEPECEDFVGCTSPVSVCRVPVCVQENPNFDPGNPNDPLQPFCLVDDQHNPWKPQGLAVISAFFAPLVGP